MSKRRGVAAQFVHARSPLRRYLTIDAQKATRLKHTLAEVAFRKTSDPFSKARSSSPVVPPRFPGLREYQWSLMGPRRADSGSKASSLARSRGSERVSKFSARQRGPESSDPECCADSRGLLGLSQDLLVSLEWRAEWTKNCVEKRTMRSRGSQLSLDGRPAGCHPSTKCRRGFVAFHDSAKRSAQASVRTFGQAYGRFTSIPHCMFEFLFTNRE